jgi:hypothetical protein
MIGTFAFQLALRPEDVAIGGAIVHVSVHRVAHVAVGTMHVRDRTIVANLVGKSGEIFGSATDPDCKHVHRAEFSTESGALQPKSP